MTEGWGRFDESLGAFLGAKLKADWARTPRGLRLHAAETNVPSLVV